MHRGHLEESPDCPCPAPRGREIVEPINAFHRICRRQRVPVIHVKTVLRASGVDDTKGYRSAWRLTFPMTAGPIPNADAHGLQGTRWTEFVTEVLLDDHVVDSKKRLAFSIPPIWTSCCVTCAAARSCSPADSPTAACSTPRSTPPTGTIGSSSAATWCGASPWRWRTPRCGLSPYTWGSSWILPTCWRAGSGSWPAQQAERFAGEPSRPADHRGLSQTKGRPSLPHGAGAVCRPYPPSRDAAPAGAAPSPCPRHG